MAGTIVSEERPAANRYSRIIERIFQRHRRDGSDSFEFDRDEIVSVAVSWA